MRVVLLLLALAATSISHGQEPGFLKGYTGQSTEQLIALAPHYRVDSIVLAFEQAIDLKAAKGRKLSQVENDIVAIEAMEREVNNGGYHQFFINSSKAYAHVLPASLV